MNQETQLQVQSTLDLTIKRLLFARRHFHKLNERTIILPISDAQFAVITIMEKECRKDMLLTAINVRVIILDAPNESVRADVEHKYLSNLKKELL